MNFNKYFVFLKAKWQESLEYRIDMFFYSLSVSLLPIMGMIIWLAFSATGTKLPMDKAQLTHYFIMIILVANITASWKAWFVNEDIRTGNLSKYLTKPLSYLLVNFADVWGQKLVRLMFLIPSLIVIGFLVLGKDFLIFNVSTLSFLLFIVSLLLAFWLWFTIDMIMGLLGFWLHDVDFLRGLSMLLEYLFSGKFIPIIFLPLAFQEISFYTPFRYIVSFPVEVLLQMVKGRDLFIGFGIQFFWLAVLLIVYQFIYHKGLKLYQGYGS